MTTPLSVID